MSTLIIYDTVSSVFEMLWDIVLAYFVVRLGLIYAASVGALCAVATLFLTWPTQQPALLPPGTINPLTLSIAVAAAQLAATVVCARLVVSRQEVPRDWRLRGPVGLVGAAVLAMSGYFLKTAARDMVGPEAMMLPVGGKAFMLGVAAMPLALMALEPRTGPHARENSWLPIGNEKLGY